MLKKLLLLPLLFWSLTLQAAGVSTPATILVLGDSISAAYGINTNEGWVALLQQRLTQKGFNYRVVNASVSGDTTRTGLNRLPDALQQHHPAIVIVALGGNDGLRGLPFSEIEASLTGIIQLSRQHDARVVLAGVRLPPNYGAFYNTRFATLFQTLSDTYHVALVPKLLDQVADHHELMQEDGIHPTATAQPQILDNVWPHLQPLLSTQQAS
ncbi:MAG: arylesterase, partial [Thiohalomonadales bacterium]|nr:arylesterase [Thiohalomonadales bacterium]